MSGGILSSGSVIEGLPADAACWWDVARQVFIVRRPRSGVVRIRLMSQG